MSSLYSNLQDSGSIPVPSMMAYHQSVFLLQAVLPFFINDCYTTETYLRSNFEVVYFKYDSIEWISSLNSKDVWENFFPDSIGVIFHLMFHLIFRSIWYDGGNYYSRYYPAVAYSIIQYIHLKMPTEKNTRVIIEFV